MKVTFLDPWHSHKRTANKCGMPDADSWFPSKITRFSFYLLRKPKKHYLVNLVCGPLSQEKLSLIFSSDNQSRIPLEFFVIALSSVKATRANFFQGRTGKCDIKLNSRGI